MDYFIKKSDGEIINPEEILLDKLSAEKADTSKFEVPIKKRNFSVLFVGAILILALFAARAWSMQITRGDFYASLAKNNKTRSYPIAAHRGVIYDRNMTPLLANVPSLDLAVVPADLSKNKEERERMIVSLAKAIRVPDTVLLERFSKISLAEVMPVLIKENIDRDLALSLETRLSDFPGITIKKNAVRQYSDGPTFSHILGYIGRVSEPDLKSGADFSTMDYVGKSGVEQTYDTGLRGLNGAVEMEIDSISRLKKEKKTREEISGNNVVLTIDAGLQKKIAESLVFQLENTPSATGAAAVALNPKTGAILALVSLPSYDNNIFSTSASMEAYSDLERDPQRPFFNRALTGQYPSGSSIKPFVAVAALEEKTITKNTTIVSTGAISIINQYNPDIVYTFRDWKEGGHGATNVVKAIAESVNTFFYTIGGGHGDIEGLGSARIKRYLNLFGFGGKTSVDLPGEKEGLVPDREWKEKTLKENWVLGDTYNFSIGQGNLLVTPLQLAVGYAALANGGTLLKPHIVEKIIDKDKKVLYEARSEKIRDNFISGKNLEIARTGMREAVLSGSARRLADLPVAVAGKTGTAQAPGNADSHAWFASFAPYDNPEIVLVILVEHGGEGSQTAAPVAREVYQWYFSGRK